MLECMTGYQETAVHLDAVAISALRVHVTYVDMQNNVDQPAREHALVMWVRAQCIWPGCARLRQYAPIMR